jgi:pilus assembly protein Flp/PilA
MLTDLRRRIRSALTRAQRAEEGQGLVEYALILILIAVVVIVILAVVGQQVTNVYSNIGSAVGT